MSAVTLALVAGDTAPIELTYRENRLPIDITGHSFAMKIGYDEASGGPVSIAGTPLDQTVDANLGKFTVSPTAGQVLAGQWPWEILVVYPGGAERTFKQSDLFITGRIV